MGIFRDHRRLTAAQRIGENSKRLNLLENSKSYVDDSELVKLSGKISRDEELLKIYAEKVSKSKTKQKNISKSKSVHNECNGVKVESPEINGIKKTVNKSKKK